MVFTIFLAALESPTSASLACVVRPVAMRRPVCWPWVRDGGHGEEAGVGSQRLHIDLPVPGPHGQPDRALPARALPGEDHGAAP